MKLMTSRFGNLEINEEQLYGFTKGLPGFDELQRFALLPVAGNPVWHWLQSAEEPGVAFLLVDPFVFFPGYIVDLGPEQERELGLRGPGEAVVYAVVSAPPQGVRQMTANLVAPVVINSQQRRGIQVILAGTPYTTRHRLLTSQQTSKAAGAE